MSSEGPGPLRRLGAALLNATLLLAAIVLALAVTLVVQLRGFADDLRGGLRTELVALQPQVQAVRDSAHQAMTALESARAARPSEPALGAAEENLRAVLGRLEALEPGPETRAETESLLHQLAILVITTAMRGVMGDYDTR